MKCEFCSFESEHLDEVFYMDENYNIYSTEYDIENNADCLQHTVCLGCFESAIFGE